MRSRTALSLALLSFSLPAAARFSPQEIAAADSNPRAFTIDEASVEIVELGPAPTSPAIPPPDAGGGDAIVILDSIINIGSKLWQIVVDNKPVVDIRTQYATALPEGVKNWAAMEGWLRPQGTVYRLSAKNAYGGTVINLRYQVLRTAGGSYKGAGKYLTAVTVEPLFVEVAWGYKFTMEASAPDTSVVNVGTGENPVAAMIVQLAWRISTPIKDSSGKGIYYLQGDGAYQEIGGPFKRDGVDVLKARIAKTLEETLTYGP